MKDFSSVLGCLPDGSCVAVVTMTGSCCPVTLGHIQGFIESRRILLGADQFPSMDPFAEVLGLLSLNGDGHVSRKMASNGEPHICYRDRSRLVEFACVEHEWLSFNPSSETEAYRSLVGNWPQFRFVHYCLNGADDVVRYRKWRHACDLQRYIAMGRPGYTNMLIEQARKAEVSLTTGLFVVGPELPNISSTAVRDSLRSKNVANLAELLHPSVMEWCLEKGPYQPTRTKSPSRGTCMLPKHASGEFKGASCEEGVQVPECELRIASDSMMRRVFRHDRISGTLLRKVATDDRTPSVWIDSLKSVANGERVKVLRLDGHFAWVLTEDGVEGFLKAKYLEEESGSQ